MTRLYLHCLQLRNSFDFLTIAINCLHGTALLSDISGKSMDFGDNVCVFVVLD